jgi:hypothetical protein
VFKRTQIIIRKKGCLGALIQIGEKRYGIKRNGKSYDIKKSKHPNEKKTKH